MEAGNAANFADVIYNFPFSPKELGVTVNSMSEEEMIQGTP